MGEIEPGSVFGRLTLVERAPKRTYDRKPIRGRERRRTYEPRWIVRCACGITLPTPVRERDLCSGHTSSCGKCAKQTHGECNSPTYQSWRAMRKRCNDPKNVSYPNYGGRGITVCAEWNDGRTGYAAFVHDVGVRPKGMTLDRRDVEGNYEPGNCRWATSVEQAANKRGRGRYATYATYAEDAAENAHWEEMEREYAENDV